jgi:ABC-2 type transport system permease protein
MKKETIKYWRVWKQLMKNATNSYLSNRIDSLFYFFGKVVRFVFFFILIVSLFRFTSSIAGYSKQEVIIFFLTFNLVDVIAQAIFRGIYTFSDEIKRGNFDFVLSKPINPLFYSMNKLADILDFVFLIPIVVLLLHFLMIIGVAITPVGALLYCGLFFVSLIIVSSIHILTAAASILMVENENLIWVYRESMTIGRFPPELFSLPIQFVFTFCLPVIIMIGFPVKALLGLLSWKMVLVALIYSIVLLSLSIFLWQKGLEKYSSASS